MEDTTELERTVARLRFSGWSDNDVWALASMYITRGDSRQFALRGQARIETARRGIALEIAL